MRLIDADALRERYQFCHDVAPDTAVVSRAQLEGDIAMLDAAPTVSCEECVWDDQCPMQTAYRDSSLWISNFGCAYFEGREP